MSAGIETTDDAVLGGRLRLLQPRRGHRVGHDAILLAAATGARAGELAVDFGAGIGGAGLALAWRVPGLRVGLIEIDPALAALARENASRNGMADRVHVMAGNVEDVAALGLKEASADHVLMNPPFNDPASQQSSPDARRRLAHVADSDLLSRWVESAAWVLKPRGTLTLIWRAAALEAVLAALTPAFGDVAVMAVMPRPGAEAIRVLVRAIKGGAGRLPDLPPLTLNDENGRPSHAAEAVLREAKVLALAHSADS